MAITAAPTGADHLPICPSRVRVYHRETGRRLLLPCRRRVCSFCGPRYWRPRVLAGLHSGLRQTDAPYLALLLTAPGDVNASEWNAEASVSWHRFSTYLRRHWGHLGAIDYWRVAELQERGHVHFHVVVRGLAYLPITNASGTGLRDLAVRAGFGPWVGVRRPRDYPGGVRSVGWYFSKYLLKSYTGRGGVTKLVTLSQGWRVGWVTHRREGPSEWVFVGSAHAGWDKLGTVLPAPKARAAPRERASPSWWRPEPWQYARARWADTERLFG